MLKLLTIAAQISLKGVHRRKAHIGCVGIRRDGTVVQSWNGCAHDVAPSVHAEARLARKLDVGSVVYVARTRRDNGKIAISKPCRGCYLAMKHRGVAKCYYTISENEWGCIDF
jgi:tRNA(Arg) A34 adenosine deaminase TadA